MQTQAPSVDVEFRNIRKVFGGQPALADVSLHIRQGELLSLLGPSGCGKTTLLRILAGFVSPTAGDVVVGGQRLNAVAPNKRNVGMVFQNYSLFPHMTVFENVVFGLKMRRLDSASMRRRAMTVLDLVHMADLHRSYPGQLSGGMQQRVALARVLAIQPSVLLLDEPFGALDRRLKDEMQVEVRKLQQMLKITTLFVTHDQREAMIISDRVAVMNAGRIEQEGPPVEIYDHPRTRFIADFLGIRNLLPARVVSTRPGRVGVEIADGSRMWVACPAEIDTRDVVVALRAELVHLSAADETCASPDGVPAEALSLSGRVGFVTNLGSQVTYEIELSGGLQLIAEVPRIDHRGAFAPGDGVKVHIQGQHCRLMQR